MEKQYYQEYFTAEDNHWWHVGRRRILAGILARHKPAGTEKLLEVGCCGGGNLSLLKDLGGKVTAVEMESEAVAVARERGLGSIVQGKLGDSIPELQSHYDLVALFDVLEHIQDDAAALQQIRDLLSPGGRVFITVPAYQWLWTEHDAVNQHYRRYTRRQLMQKLERRGFRVLYASYFNTLLFPVAAAAMLLSRSLPFGQSSARRQPAPVINCLLENVFAGERAAIPRFRLAFGLSIVIVAEAIAR